MPLEALKRMPKRFFPFILFIPFLIGCHNVKPVSVSEEVFSYESLSIDEIPSYNEPVFDETGTAIPTESPHYKVTIEENPEVVWDDSQSNLRTGTKTLDFYNINDIHGTVDESGNVTNGYACGVKQGSPNAGTAFCIEGDVDGSLYQTNETFLNNQTTGLWEGR